jgi:hypothetical protein
LLDFQRSIDDRTIAPLLSTVIITMRSRCDASPTYALPPIDQENGANIFVKYTTRAYFLDSEIPAAPLTKRGIRTLKVPFFKGDLGGIITLKVPFFKGDLGGSRLGYNPDLDLILVLFQRTLAMRQGFLTPVGLSDCRTVGLSDCRTVRLSDIQRRELNLAADIQL